MRIEEHDIDFIIEELNEALEFFKINNTLLASKRVYEALVRAKWVKKEMNPKEVVCE